MKILIVEDNAPLANVLAAWVTRLSKKTSIVATLEEAFAGLMGSVKYDTVLLDLNLPDSGPGQTLEAVKKMKEIGANVVVMTGRKDDEILNEVEASGADAWLCKSDPDFVTGIREAVVAGSRHPFVAKTV